MFKIETYITPLLLSYVDKYIKNFRPEDYQVSLWGGDVSFHNLDLRLEVLEQELQLPFSFVSGHIHELLIHVPWTKLYSEPIAITINTIECILKLQGTESNGSDTASSTSRRSRRRFPLQAKADVPPSYLKHLINKVISNIMIKCNNIILKYVEEDIVVSMNMKTLSVQAATANWQPGFIDIPMTKIILRKLITLTDLTVCLDKRNAAGKIDVYQEPVLYRCSMEMRLLLVYHSSRAKRATTTRLDIHCSNMGFSMNEQQIPMLMRLISLLIALQNRQLKSESQIQLIDDTSTLEDEEVESPAESWMDWAWSYVPTLVPHSYEDDLSSEQRSSYSGSTVHIGFYVDNIRITFKVSESSESSYYVPRKLKYWPVLTLWLKNSFFDIVSHGIAWLNTQVGVSYASLMPQGHCSCGYLEVADGAQPPTYFKAGSQTEENHKINSLFDSTASENQGQPKLYNVSWDQHFRAVSENTLLERTPAFAVDYLYQLELPQDISSERLSELGNDYEYSNFYERAIVRVVSDSLTATVCSGLFHRLSTLLQATTAYDYLPYYIPPPDPSLSDLLPPSAEDFDALNENIPKRITQVTFFSPKVEFVLMDHPYFEASKGNLYRKKKHVLQTSSSSILDLPKITLECKCFDAKIENPMYPRRLVHTTCQLPSAPSDMFYACYTHGTVKLVGITGHLFLEANKQTTVVMPGNVSFKTKMIIKPQYWINVDIVHREINFELDGLTVTGTKAKLMVVAHVVETMLVRDAGPPNASIFNTSLLNDSCRDYGMPCLELCIESIMWKNIVTIATVSHDVKIGGVKAFIFEPVDNKPGASMAETNQVLIVSGPEISPSPTTGNLLDPPLLTVVLQYPIDPDVQVHVPLLIFNTAEMKVCFDPLLFSWLFYSPKLISNKTDFVWIDPVSKRKKSASETSTVETPKRITPMHESVHSSSEREYIFQQVPIVSEQTQETEFYESVRTLVLNWFPVWTRLVLCGDFAQCTIYFPISSLSALGSQGIEQTVQNSLKNETHPQILVINLPFASVRSASQRQGLTQYTNRLPVKLPEILWNSDEPTFPWNISVWELSCYTLQYSKQLFVLHPFSCTATVGLSIRLRDSSTDLSVIDSTVPPEPNKKVAPLCLTKNESKELHTHRMADSLVSLGVCIHVDTSPVHISISELQAALLVSVLCGIRDISHILLTRTFQKSRTKKPEPMVPPSRISPTLSSSVHKDSFDNSISAKSDGSSSAETVLTEESCGTVKLTTWLQWTIENVTMELHTHQTDSLRSHSDPYKQSPELKLVLNMEDVMSSLDVQSVFAKFKLKIASANIQHYKKTKSNTWQLGEYLGLVMRGRDSFTGSSEVQDEDSFLTLTVTRAKCAHVHKKWGTSNKNTLSDTKIDSLTKKMLSESYMTEIVAAFHPLDFLLSVETLRPFSMIFDLIGNVPQTPAKEVDSVLSKVNNATLPLIFCDFREIRLIIPAADLVDKIDRHDVVVLQVFSVGLVPSADNPICRVPVRPDLYQHAVKAGMINIPGSELEDRQYQLNVNGVTVDTVTWRDMDSLLSLHGSTVPTMRTMIENPALEWNNLEGGRLSITPNFFSIPIINRFNLIVIAAPAMVYKDDILVCSHSIEVNCVSDLNISVNIEQLQLISALLAEVLRLFEPLLVDAVKRPRVVFPYSKITPMFDVFEEALETVGDPKDSGIDTVEMRSDFTPRTKESPVVSISTDTRSRLCDAKYPKMIPPMVHAYFPIEILFAGGQVKCALYQLVSDIPSPKEKLSLLEKAKRTANSPSRDTKTVVFEQTAKEKSEMLRHRQVRPVVFLSFVQPNAYLSRLSFSRKMQVSCFDIQVKANELDAPLIKRIPNEKDFAIDLLETRSGDPDPLTGVYPSLITIKWSHPYGKVTSLSVDIARPTKIVYDPPRWDKLFLIADKVMEDFRGPSMVEIRFSDSSFGGITKCDKTTSMDKSFVKFNMLRKLLWDINIFDFKLSQIMVVLKGQSGCELSLSCGKIKTHLAIGNRPENITNDITVECLTIGLQIDKSVQLLLNPWSFTAEICFFWESWQSPLSDPQLQITAESDSIMLDLGPLHLKSLELLVRDFKNVLVSSSEENLGRSVSVFEQDQHYKDDLRAGAFQFVDASCGEQELPQPYQVMFWNHPFSAMAWRYPQPRVLTKVRAFPVPFKTFSEHWEDRKVYCNLEYWSACRSAFQPYVQFQLSESEVYHLNLPDDSPNAAVSSTWRVVLSTSTDGITFDMEPSKIMISPRALAACMRIDSYFNSLLVPKIQTCVNISSINVSLYNHISKENMLLPKPLDIYTLDGLIPQNQCFLNFVLQNVKLCLSCWHFDMLVDVTQTVKCEVLDYAFLTQQCFVEPFTMRILVSLSNQSQLNIRTDPVVVRFGLSVGHTLSVAVQTWNQLWSESTVHLAMVMVTRYVVCNDTNINLRFGQAATDEDILLPPRYCHFYCWRSQKSKAFLHVGLEENGWAWSKPFSIFADGTEVYDIGLENKYKLIVTVRSLSSTQKQIVFSGQLVICNMLVENFEVRIVPVVAENKDKEFRRSPTHIIAGKSTPPSYILNTQQQYVLRIKFQGLESAWSGDIPLAENTHCIQPWLVKVPLRERGQFLSVWCRILIHQFDDGKKILATLWPLFMIRSNLPIKSKVHIDTPTLSYNMEATVEGRGSIQQLYCPGTIDHSHHLTFQLDSGIPTSDPYVPLNYSLVDQKEFFKREGDDIDAILKVLQSFDKSEWPYLNDDVEVDWIACDQPLTHVQVRYQNASQYSSALMVDLIPWCLLTNTLGCPVSIIINDRELCQVCHHGIIVPPSLDDTFNLGVLVNDVWSVSLPLSLGKSDWGQGFYMPRISGIIPLEGNIVTPVSSGACVTMVSITSYINNDIRMLRIGSSHIIVNHTSLDLYIACLAVPPGDDIFGLPFNLDKYCFHLPPDTNESGAGLPIITWYLMAETARTITEYYLYILISADDKCGWSCPIRVDSKLTRRGVSLTTPSRGKCFPIAVTSVTNKSQNYISIHRDYHPQLFIENRCDFDVYCAQPKMNEEKSIVNDAESFDWVCCIEAESEAYYSTPSVAERFPDIPQTNSEEYLVIAVEPQENEKHQWSQPIDITNLNYQFVRIPHYGDIKISITLKSRTTYISIESVGQAEISARDVRGRLLQFESESSLDINNEVFATFSESTEVFEDARDELIARESHFKSDRSTTVTDSFMSADNIASYSETNIHGRKLPLPPLHEQSHVSVLHIPSAYQRHWSRLNLKQSDVTVGQGAVFYTSAGQKWNSVNICIFIKSFAFILMTDSHSGDGELTEIAALTLDNIAVTSIQNEEMEICVSVSDVQLDNQMYWRGGYDFPVVLVNQESSGISRVLPQFRSTPELVREARMSSCIRVNVAIESWMDNIDQTKRTVMKDVVISIKPIAVYLEDVFVTRVLEYMTGLSPTQLILWQEKKDAVEFPSDSRLVNIPSEVLCEADILARPLSLQSLTIETVSVLLSMHSFLKLYIALDQSPLEFGRFERRRILTTPYRLGHTVTMHFLSDAIFGAGWVVGSIELLGSPGGLARAVGHGLRDFVSLPYHGLIQGPWAFLLGVTHGSASLMRHITAGTLYSVTKFAESFARNLNRLTLDEEHLRRTEEQRRLRPQGLTEGLLQGLTGLGISLLGAVGGIAHHPIQSVMSDGVSPRGLAAGVGLGLVGVITKPLSGAAELVALTGQGLLHGAGWNSAPEVRTNPIIKHIFTSSNAIVKYCWKLMTTAQSNLLFVIDATSVDCDDNRESVALVLMSEILLIINTELDVIQRIVPLSAIIGTDSTNDPTQLRFNISLSAPPLNNDIAEISRARIAEYVRNSAGVMRTQSESSVSRSEFDVSPSSSLPATPVNESESCSTLTFYVNSHSRNYFLNMLAFAKFQRRESNFPVF